MSTNDKAWAHNGVLWQIGARFVDALPDDADRVVADAIEQLVGNLEADWVSVSTVDHRTLESQQDHRWARRPELDFGAGTSVEIDSDFGARLIAGDGTEVAQLDEILGATVVNDRGWTGGSAVVSRIDQTPVSTTALVVAGVRCDWTDGQIDLMQGFATLLRQFRARVRVERKLNYRLALEDLVTSVSARLMMVGPDDCEDAVRHVLHEVHESLEAEATVLVEVVGESAIEIRHQVSTRELPEVFSRLDVPDLSRLPGWADQTLYDYVAKPRVLDIVELVESLAGTEMVDALELREPARTLALLPASVTAAGRSVIALTRLGDDSVWRAEEFDAMTTVASLIAHARGRVAAERASAFRVEVQRALAETAAVFLTVDEAGVEGAVREALERMCESLGADIAGLTTVERDPDRIVPTVQWVRGTGMLAGDGPSVHAEDGWIDRLEAGEVIGGHAEGVGDSGMFADGWWFLLAPIRIEEGELGAVGIGWFAGYPGEESTIGDLVLSTADLIGQLRSRVRAQAEMARRLELDVVLAEIADEFLGAAAADHDRIVTAALGRISGALGLAGATVRRFEGEVVVTEALHAPRSRLEVGAVSPAGRSGQAARIRRGEWVHLVDPPRDWADWLQDQWGFVGSMVFGPITVGNETRAALSGIRPDDSEWSAMDIDAFRSFGIMLGQLRARVEAQRTGEHQLAAQRLLGECAVQLAEARAEDLQSTITSVLQKVGRFLTIESLWSWQVDRSICRYVDRVGWATEDELARTPATECGWNEFEALDEARRTGRRVVTEVDEANVHGRFGHVSVPRGDGDRVDSIMLASSTTAGSWRADTIQILEALSHTIHQVETRVAAEQYADAAFAAAPIGVVLRDSELRLVACNQAFVEFIGADSVEELIGTSAAEVHDGSLEDVGWEDRAGNVFAEAAFRRRNGGRVWGQMRATVIDGPHRGEHLWLIHIEDITERRRAEQLLRFQASHDELTGLANRRELLEEVRRVAAGSGSVAILLLDLDRFKLINDSLGHDRGDELLVVVADRLRLAVRPGDLVARLGGDEFAVVLPGPVTVSEAEFVADRLLGLIGEPITLGRQEVFPTASIGIAVADDDVAVSDLLRRADTAMYRAKAQGRARHEAFDEVLRDEVMARMATEAGLRGALRNDELVVHYQPEVSLITGEVLAVEALVRWNHPERGLVVAGEFIEIAEETGLVVEIGELVLSHACQEAVSWSGDPLLRVNLAAAQIQRDDTIGVVRSALVESGLPAERLCLEITESAMMSDLERSEETLDRLKELGVKLAVDDFGTGFSSLAYLKLFPVDVLKIDRAFVSGLGVDADDTAFVRSIVSLAEALDLEVVAEGVETEEQSAALLELGCVRAQGYLFARPGPAIDVRTMLGQS